MAGWMGRPKDDMTTRHPQAQLRPPWNYSRVAADGNRQHNCIKATVEKSSPDWGFIALAAKMLISNTLMALMWFSRLLIKALHNKKYICLAVCQQSGSFHYFRFKEDTKPNTDTGVMKRKGILNSSYKQNSHLLKMKASGQVSINVIDGFEVTDVISEIRKSSEVTHGPLIFNFTIFLRCIWFTSF